MTDKTKASTPETEETEHQNRKSRFWQGIDKTAGAFAAGCLAVLAVVAIWMFFQQSANVQPGQQAAAPESTIVASTDGANRPIQRAAMVPIASTNESAPHFANAEGKATLLVEVGRSGRLNLVGSPRRGFGSERIAGTELFTLKDGQRVHRVAIKFPLSRISQRHLEQGISLCFEWRESSGRTKGTCQVLKPRHVRDLVENPETPKYFYF